MMNIKGIFAVSFIAMVAMVAGAHTSNAVAAIASQGYVDQQIGTKVSTTQGSAAANKAVITNASGNITTGTISSAMITDGTITNADIASNAQIAASKVDGLAKVATSGSYNDLDDTPTIPTVNNGQLTINVNGTPHSFTANQAGGTTVDIDIPDEVDFSGLSGSTTGNGNVVTNVTQTNGKVSATKGITAEETKNKVKSVRAVASATDTAYPSEKAVATALAGKVATAQGSAAANKAVITNASGDITTGTISSAMITDGTITNADIAANAQIEASKVDGLAKVATSGLYNDLDDKPTIPTVNNATLTIQKNGATVDTFTANASADKTINITVPTATSQLTNDSDFITAEQLPDGYTLPVATADTLGGVKSGGDITVSSTGAVTVNSATQADSATTAETATNAKNAVRAENDAEGNDIILTYATKAQITALDSTSTGTGAVVTDVSQSAGEVSVTRGNVKIPVGGENATSYATIWIQ